MPSSPVHVLQDVEHEDARLVVECAGGLVAEEHVRGLGHGPGDGDALLLAARELGGEVVARSPSPTRSIISRGSRGSGAISVAIATFSSAVRLGTRL